MNDQRGLLIVLSGPSGAGKDAIMRLAQGRRPSLRRSISVTTRPPRPGEVEGREYFFCAEEEFRQRAARGEFLEWALYLGHLYGTPRSWVKENLAAGGEVVLEIDVQGARTVAESHPDPVLIFVAPPSWDALAERLRGRQTENEQELRRRLEHAKREWQEVCEGRLFHYVIENDRLEEAVHCFHAIVAAEHCRRERVRLPALEDDRG